MKYAQFQAGLTGFTEPGPAEALAAGIFAVPDVPAASGVQASGSFIFTGQPNANETVTVGTTVLTWVSGTPGAGQVQIGASQAASQTALAAAITAAVPYVTAVSSGANVNVTSIRYGAIDNTVALAETMANAEPSAPTLTGGLDGAVSLDALDSDLRVGAGATLQLNLGNGVNGQEKCLLATSVGAGGTIVVVYGAYGQKITFSAVGQFARLKFLNGSWFVTSITGAVQAATSAAYSTAQLAPPVIVGTGAPTGMNTDHA